MLFAAKQESKKKKRTKTEKTACQPEPDTDVGVQVDGKGPAILLLPAEMLPRTLALPEFFFYLFFISQVDEEANSPLATERCDAHDGGSFLLHWLSC